GGGPAAGQAGRGRGGARRQEADDEGDDRGAAAAVQHGAYAEGAGDRQGVVRGRERRRGGDRPDGGAGRRAGLPGGDEGRAARHGAAQGSGRRGGAEAVAVDPERQRPGDADG